MEKVRLASVGLGRWARVLARGAQRGDVIDLVSCFSPGRGASAGAFQEEFGIGRSAASYEELLADPEVEGVLITTPNDTHRDLILQALEAGKGVYTDKPIAHTLEHAVAIAEAATQSGQAFAVGHSARRLAGCRVMKQLDRERRARRRLGRGGELLERARPRAEREHVALLRRTRAPAGR